MNKKHFYLILIAGINFTISLYLHAREYDCTKLDQITNMQKNTENAPVLKNIYDQTVFFKLGTIEQALQKTHIKAGFSKSGIYLRINCEEENMEKINKQAENHEEPWNNDCIQIFIMPEGQDTYYQFIVNIHSKKWSSIFTTGEEKLPLSLEMWKAKLTTGKTFWTVDIYVPFTCIGQAPTEVNEKWRLNICRTCITESSRMHSSWSACGISFHSPGDWGYLIFKDTLSSKALILAQADILRHKLAVEKLLIEDSLNCLKKHSSESLRPICMEEWENIKQELSEVQTYSQLTAVSYKMTKMKAKIEREEALYTKYLIDYIFNFKVQ